MKQCLSQVTRNGSPSCCGSCPVTGKPESATRPPAGGFWRPRMLPGSQSQAVSVRVESSFPRGVDALWVSSCQPEYTLRL